METHGRGAGLTGVLGLAFLASLVYAAWIFLPVYADDLNVGQAAAQAFLEARHKSDGALKDLILEKLAGVGHHEGVDSFNRPELKDGLGLTHDDILIERSNVNDEVEIQVRYHRRVIFKPTKQYTTLKFKHVKKGIPPA